MADRPLNDGPGNRHAPCWTAGQSVDVTDRLASKTAGSSWVSGTVAHVSKHRLGLRRRDAIADRPLGTGDPRPAIGHGRTIGRHLSGLSFFLQRQTEVVAFALPARCSGITRVLSTRRHKHLPTLPPITQI